MSPVAGTARSRLTPAGDPKPAVVGHVGAPAPAMRCRFCHRTHVLEPVDDETQAVCRVVDVVWQNGVHDSTANHTFELVCDGCIGMADRATNTMAADFLQSHYAAEIRPVSPLVQLQHVDAEVNEELSSLLSAIAPEDEWRREEWRVVADRLLKRVGEDEAEVAAIMSAAELEVALVRGNAARQAQVVENRLWWRRNALQAIAEALFPTDDVRTNIGGKKSLALTHGTIGRKDFKATPELRDGEAALKALRNAQRWDVVKLTVKTTVASFVDRVAMVIEAVRGSETATPRGTALALVVDLLTEQDDERPLATNEVAWGDLKKQLQETGEVIDGVEYSAPRVEWIATPNKAE